MSSSHVSSRLQQIQQELNELRTLSKPTPEALQRLQVLAAELQALQNPVVPAPCFEPPPPICAPPPPPVPPVLANYNNYFPLYGGEPPVCAPLPPCGGCGYCELCYDPCAPAAYGNPFPISVFQGPNGCAPAYTLQGPPGLVGPTGPSGSGGGGDCCATAAVCEGTLYYLRAPGPHDSIGLVATGPLVRTIPDSDVPGGDCRGQYATDWQGLRVLSSQVAAGTGSILGGGFNNEANGYNANIFGGNANLIEQGDWEVQASELQSYSIAYNPLLPLSTGTNPNEFGTTLTGISNYQFPGCVILGGQTNHTYGTKMTYLSQLIEPEVFEFTNMYSNQNLIGLGVENTITGASSVILNGYNNKIYNAAFINVGGQLINLNNSIIGEIDGLEQLGSLPYNGHCTNIFNGIRNNINVSGFCSIDNGIANRIGDAIYNVDPDAGNQINRFCTILNGTENTITGCEYSSIGVGSDNIVTKNYSYIIGGEGCKLTETEYSCAVGLYNDDTDLSFNVDEVPTTSPRIFMVGNGVDDSTRSNAFSVTQDGWAHGMGFDNTGADYAEYFEAATVTIPLLKNGMSVTIDPATGFIRPAEPNERILGVIRSKRGNMSVVGNSASDRWQGMYLTNEDGDIVYQTVTKTVPNLRPNAPPIVKTRDVPVINPAYDPKKKYISRSARPEWFVVGLLGRVLLRIGQPTSDRWIRLKSYNSIYEEWYISP